MIQRIRSFFRTSETGVAVTVGVVGGLLLFYVVEAIVNGFLLGYIEYHPASNFSRGLEVNLFGAHLEYQTVLANGVALIVVAAVGYLLFVWPGGEPAGAALKTRECPECKSDIWADARRCPHCTSAVTPMVDDAVGS